MSHTCGVLNVTENPSDVVSVSDHEDRCPDPCTLCGGTTVSLGGLGRRQWFRCEDCGIDQSSLFA